jgi:hypothetical protein
MSTKIYNGRLIAAHLHEAYDLLMKIKSQIKETGESLIAAWLVNDAVRKIDNQHIKRTSEKITIIESWNEFIDRNKKIKTQGYRDPSIDFECEAWIFPVNDKTLIIFNTEKSEFRKIIDENENIHNYGYWDNTDPDPDCTEEEWIQRGKDWDNALGETGVPNDRCLIMSMFSGERFIPDRNEIIKHLPSKEDRAKSLARQFHINEIIEKHFNSGYNFSYENHKKVMEIIKSEQERAGDLFNHAMNVIAEIGPDDLYKGI